MTVDLAADAALFLADFAEPVVYRPRTGGARSVLAIVDREPPAFLAEAEGFRVPTIHVLVLNDAEAGIAATEIDAGGDRLDVPVRQGGPPVTKAVARIVQQDGGFVRLEVR